MTITELYIEKLKELVKSQIGQEQSSGFKLLTHYYPNDAKDQIDDIFKIIESDIASLEKQIEQETITDADIEAYFKTWQNPRIKTADEQYEKWLNQYLDELIDSAIEGAKAMRDGEIKHIET